MVIGYFPIGLLIAKLAFPFEFVFLVYVLPSIVKLTFWPDKTFLLESFKVTVIEFPDWTEVADKDKLVFNLATVTS